MHTNEAWSFETTQFRVALLIEPEDMDPADSFQLADDIEAVRNGSIEWFRARVVVYGPNGQKLGSDSLGGCAYRSTREFYTSHRDPNPMNRNSSVMRAARGDKVVICHYFPDMVRCAIAEARKTICNMPKLRCA